MNRYSLSQNIHLSTAIRILNLRRGGGDEGEGERRKRKGHHFIECLVLSQLITEYTVVSWQQSRNVDSGLSSATSKLAILTSVFSSLKLSNHPCRNHLEDCEDQMRKWKRTGRGNSKVLYTHDSHF